MDRMSLLARISYTIVTLPVVAAAGFYTSMQVLPQLTARHPGLDPAMDGSGIFQIAIFVGIAAALSASLLVLTLPWARHRKRHGRTWRIAVSTLAVVIASIMFADQGYGWIADLAFVAWITYTLALTFVRYGVIDQTRPRSGESPEGY